MIAHVKENGETCECKHSYCEYGVEICRRCGRRGPAISYLEGRSPYVVDPYLYGYSFKFAQGYKGTGIIQKY